MSTQTPKTIQMCFTSASNKIHQRMFDNGSLKTLASAIVLNLIDYGNTCLSDA